jgi:hypothetical protein
MAQVDLKACCGPSPVSWWRLAVKTVFAALLFLPLSLLLAQAPVGDTEVDADGYTMLKPVEQLVENKIAQGQWRSKILGVHQGRTPYSGDIVRDFSAYYRRFYFPMMTRTSEEDLKGLADERNRFLRDHLENSRSKEAHDVLTALALTELTNVVRGNFHPAVRYNAMLIISSLNDQELVRGSTPRAPEPMMRALPVIREEFVRPENSDAIKLAALIGLSRHLEMENLKPQGRQAVSPDLSATIVADLLALTQAKDPPDGRETTGHEWMRRRAVEALGYAAAKRPDPAVADALTKMLRDDSEPLALRCAVAAALGKVQYQAPVRVDPAATAKELGYLAMVVCDRELTRLDTMKKIEQDRKSKMGAMGGYGGMPGGGYGGMPGGDGYDPGSSYDPGYYDSGGEGSGGYPSGMPGGMPGGTPGSQGPRPRPQPGGVAGGPGGMPGYGMPGMGMMAQDPKAYRFDYARRRIRHQLYAIQLGLTGGDDIAPPRSGQQPQAQEFKNGGVIMVATAASPERQTVERVYASVRKMILTVESADPTTADLAKLDKDLRREIRVLESLTRKLNVPVVPAVTPDTPGDDPGDVPGDTPVPTGPPAAAAAAASR